MSRTPKKARDDHGFSLVEVLVAVVILSIGTLMLAGGSLFVTRDLVVARGRTAAAAIAQSKADELRALAASTSTPCTATGFASSSSASTVGKVTLSWVVPTSGSQRVVRVITSFKAGRSRTQADTLYTSIPC